MNEPQRQPAPVAPAGQAAPTDGTSFLGQLLVLGLIGYGVWWLFFNPPTEPVRTVKRGRSTRKQLASAPGEFTVYYEEPDTGYVTDTGKFTTLRAATRAAKHLQQSKGKDADGRYVETGVYETGSDRAVAHFYGDGSGGVLWDNVR